MKEASSLMKLFKVTGVPQIIVDGEFLTSPAMVGSNRRIIGLLDYLIAEKKSLNINVSRILNIPLAYFCQIFH